MRLRFLVCVPLFLLVTCRQSPSKVIGVVPKGAGHVFWLTVKAGAEKAAAESGYTIEWNAPTLEVDASRQRDILDSMITRRLAGIALAPVDRKALAGTVDRGTAAGIPMAVFDSDVDTTNRLTYVATDNRAGGRLAAQRLAAVLGGKGKVAMIGFMPGSASTMDREAGFREEIAAHHPGMQIVVESFGMADRAKAMAVTENALTAHADLAGIFADNESSSAGALQAIKSRQAKTVKFVAFDANEQFIEDLRAGWIDALILQDPFEMGYQSVKAIATRLSGGAPAPRRDLPATLVTLANLDAKEIPPLILPGAQKRLTQGAH
ncbi:MAG: substrate-binding domain-containing protein [Acidobacteriota bacterium]